MAFYDHALSPERIAAHIAAAGDEFYHRGDANTDGSLDISDGIFLLGYLFLGGPSPRCDESANANDSPAIDPGDAIYVFNFLFRGGPTMPPPGPPGQLCGPDPPDSDEDLGCETYDPCG